MKEIAPRLFIGDQQDCDTTRTDMVIVHACKDPCHKTAVGYRGKLEDTHEFYLLREVGNHLYLNMIDPPKPLFKLKLFHEALDFIEENWWDSKMILIHCNKGESRAPTLGMIYMAWYLGIIDPRTPYETVVSHFRTVYPDYRPGEGITQFVKENWKQFDPEPRMSFR